VAKRGGRYGFPAASPTLALPNKCLAQSNKSSTGAEATKKRPDSVHDEHSAPCIAAKLQSASENKGDQMWGVLNFGAKLASRYLLPRHWIRYVLLASVVVLAILNALLVDAKLYWTAGLTGVLAVVGLIVLGIQFIRASREKAERQRLQAETAARRAAAAQARAEKIHQVRTSVTEAAKGLGGGAAHLTKSRAASFADLTKNSAAGLANH
jgi:hypothetical protein